MLQFITDGNDRQSIVEQTVKVLEGGCKWVQLRMKDFPREEIVETAKQLQPICSRHEAIFIIDDEVEIAKELGLDGVHLGKTDMPVHEAREILGEEFIIGATANTLNDVMGFSPADVDYIGLGPFRFTTTKKNLSPIIELDTYRNIATVMAGSKKEIPLVAIGGICQEDIATIMATGVDGIAVSGALAHAADPVKATSQMIATLEEILNNKLINKGLR